MKATISSRNIKVGNVLRFKYLGGSEPSAIRNVVVTSTNCPGRSYGTITAWDFKRGDYRTFSIRYMQDVYLLENKSDGLIYDGDPDYVDNRTLLKAMTDTSGKYSVYNNEDMDRVFIFDNTVKVKQESPLTITGPRGVLKIFYADGENIRVASTWGDYQCQLPSELITDLKRLIG